MAAAGETFSSRRSFTSTWAAEPRICGREALREFDVLHSQVRVVLEDLLYRGSAPGHLADLANREPALGKDGLAAEDIVALDQLPLPPREVIEASLDIVDRRIEPHHEVRAELDLPGRLVRRE